MNAEPNPDWSDPVPQGETRREKLARWLAEGHKQTRLSPREYARRIYRVAFGRDPKPEMWP